MKLNDFLAKPTKPRSRTTRTISFVNETKETELNNQIELLTSEVDRLHDMENQLREKEPNLNQILKIELKLVPEQLERLVLRLRKVMKQD